MEDRLTKIGIKGLTVTCVKGYGEDRVICAQDWLGTHARIEIFTEKAKAEEIANVIMEVAHTGGAGDGIICIIPVENILGFGLNPRSGLTKSNGKYLETIQNFQF